MDQTIPNGFYSLAEVFNILGQDVFKSDWTGQELAIGRDNLLHKALPDFEKYLIKALEPTLSGIFYQSFYKDFLNLDNQKLWNTWYSCIDNLTTLFEKHITWSQKTENPVNLSDFLAPNTPFKTSKDFIACTMRYLSNKKRLEHMLYITHLKAMIKDAKTGDVREIPFSCWLLQKDMYSGTIQIDLPTSTGIFGHHNSYMYEMYKGLFIISKKRFSNFRAGYALDYEGKTHPEEFNEMMKVKELEEGSIGKFESEHANYNKDELLNLVSNLKKQLKTVLKEKEDLLSKISSSKIVNKDINDSINTPQLAPWPAEYTTPLLEVSKIIINKYGITYTSQPKAEALGYYVVKEFFLKESPIIRDSNIKLSVNILRGLATMIRTEEAIEGGDAYSILFKEQTQQYKELKRLDEKNGIYLLNPLKPATKKS